MQLTASPQREEIQDVWYGQIVTFVARWFLTGAGLVLTFWRSQAVGEAVTPTYLLVGLIAINFFMHGRFLTGTPMRREVVLAGCVIDVAIISLVILTSRWDAAAGIDNPFYIFYYPVILAFALVFPWRYTMLFAAGVIVTYGAIILVDTPSLAWTHHSSEPVIARIATLASTAVLGNMYWRIERQFRRTQLAPRV